jgi:hypothetical protein
VRVTRVYRVPLARTGRGHFLRVSLAGICKLVTAVAALTVLITLWWDPTMPRVCRAVLGGVGHQEKLCACHATGPKRALGVTAAQTVRFTMFPLVTTRHVYRVVLARSDSLG